MDVKERTQPATADGARPSQGTKLAPRTTAKKLPWLDGRTSLTSPMSSSPPTDSVAGLTSPTAFESPLRTPPRNSATRSPKAPSKPTLRRHPVGRSIESTPPHRPKSQQPRPVERRVSSIGASIPSPIKNQRLGHVGVKNLPSPLRKQTLSGPPGVVRILDGASTTPSADYDNPFHNLQSRRESLVPIPDHLERDPTPEFIRPVQRDVQSTSPPAIIKAVQMSPSQPIPKRNPFERDNRRLSNVIEGLEDLVQEAVYIAEDNGNPTQITEVYEIIEDATTAIREASTLSPQDLIGANSPLDGSSSFEEVSEFSVPYNAPQAPRAVDWAHTAEKGPVDMSSSSSSRELSSRGDHLQPPPHAQTATRETVDFVLRPSRTRDVSRGRSKHRKESSPNHECRHYRHHRSFRRSLEEHSKPRRRRRGHTSTSPTDSSFTDEEHWRSRSRSQGRSRYRQELSMRDQAHHHTFSLRRHHRRQPIARNWSTGKKRITATIACINTALLGIIIGIYAGEVPRIQYMLADESHHAIIGNAVLFFGLAISTFVSWPLPLLHGRKPYILASLALALPLQFPQAIVISTKRSPTNRVFLTGLLVARACSGLVLGFANVNFITVLLDMFGASLQSKNPHQEIAVVNDVRRHGGGMGMWLGIWAWCSIGSLACGFQIGAGIIESLTPDWGFYIVIIILAAALVLNILAPESRRSMYRKSVTEVYDRDENFITRRVARGEIKLHLGSEGPKYWFEEVWAGIKLSVMMCFQPGFAVLGLYLGWIYAQVVLVIVLLGSLLSRDYKWYPRFVGLGVMSIAIGALLAVPLTKAGIFSRERKNAYRTDSMTFEKQVSWSSHLVRRIIFMLALPIMSIIYTVFSAGRPQPYMVPVAFAGSVGFLSVLAIAECHGLIMETFDTCDLQPGVNTRHRLESMAVQDRRRRTNYSSFPRVTAGIFASQTVAFILAAVATLVGGSMTRHLGAQASTGVTAGILFALTILLTAVLWRFKEVQVIPNHTFGTRRDTKAWEEFKQMGKDDWKAVVIGNPSGKMRRMSALELGGLSRWTEIRKLNFLIRDPKAKASSWKLS